MHLNPLNHKLASEVEFANRVMEDLPVSSCGKKRKRSPSHGKESKAHGKVEEARSALLNGGPSTTNKSSKSEELDDCWPDFLSEVELDLLVSIKRLAMERFTSLQEKCLQEILPASVLQTIGILMKELVKDHVRKLVLGHTFSSASEAALGSKEDSVRQV